MSLLFATMAYLLGLGIVALPMAPALGHQETTIGESAGGPHDLSAGDHRETISREHDLLREVVKQSIEQPLHFVMAAAPIWLSRCLTAVPWYGWTIVPALAWREWRQWPSKRWWDPPLDAAFLILGVIGATWRASPMPGRFTTRWLHRRRLAQETDAESVIRRPVSAER